MDKPRALVFGKYEDESSGAAYARAKLSAAAQPAVTLAGFGNFHAEVFATADPNAVASELAARAKAVSANDLSSLESMLTAQACSLDAMFNECSRRAAVNMGEFPAAFERYMRIALKAQSQCRCTVEALAEIKNPKSFTVVGQANVAHGPQQVNNGIAPRAEIPNPSNELLEHQDGNGLEQGASCLTGGADASLAPVAQVNGAAERQGEKALKP